MERWVSSSRFRSRPSTPCSRHSEQAPLNCGVAQPKVGASTKLPPRTGGGKRGHPRTDLAGMGCKDVRLRFFARGLIPNRLMSARQCQAPSQDFFQTQSHERIGFLSSFICLQTYTATTPNPFTAQAIPA